MFNGDLSKSSLFEEVPTPCLTSIGGRSRMAMVAKGPQKWRYGEQVSFVFQLGDSGAHFYHATATVGELQNPTCWILGV